MPSLYKNSWGILWWLMLCLICWNTKGLFGIAFERFKSDFKKLKVNFNI